MKSLKIPVIIINYRQPDNTIECLKSIRTNDEALVLQPIIIDAQPSPNFPQKLTRLFGNWVDYLPQEKNLGFTGANNVGIRFALQKYQPKTIILLNDDTTIGKKALTNLAAALQKRENCGAVVPKIYFSKEREFHQASYQKSDLGKVIWYAGGAIDWQEVHGFHVGVDEVDQGQYDSPTTTQFATGCCVALSTKALEKVGLFDEKYFLYLEDLDLSIRLQQNKFDIWYEPTSHIWHKNAGSSGSGSKLHEYYQTRNRYLFGFRYGPLRTKIFLLRHLIIQYKNGSDTIRQAIKDFILERYGPRPDVH